MLGFKSLKRLAPPYLQKMFRYSYHGHQPKLAIPISSTMSGSRSFSNAAPRLYNLLPNNIKSVIIVKAYYVLLLSIIFKLFIPLDYPFVLEL